MKTVKQETQMKTLEKECIFCKNKVEVKVKESDYENWKKGSHIQDAFPYLKPDEREIFISGICGKCFDNMF